MTVRACHYCGKSIPEPLCQFSVGDGTVAHSECLLGDVTKKLDSLRREVQYWCDQHRLADGWARKSAHRARMFMDCLAAHALLDEAGIRKEYIDALGSDILARHNWHNLSSFRRDIASLVVQTKFAQDKVNDDGARAIGDSELLAAVLKSMERAVTTCFAKDMGVVQAREQAEKIVAGIPQDIDEKPEGLFELPGGAA